MQEDKLQFLGLNWSFSPKSKHFKYRIYILNIIQVNFFTKVYQFDTKYIMNI